MARLNYRSKFEKKIRDQLVKLEIPHEYEPFKIEYRRVVPLGVCPKCSATRVYQRRRYIPDFVTANGIVLEVKGRLTATDRAKLIAVTDQHPKLDLRIIFGANNKLNKNNDKVRYLDWARKHKIKAALKEVPMIWLKDLTTT